MTVHLNFETVDKDVTLEETSTTFQPSSSSTISSERIRSSESRTCGENIPYFPSNDVRFHLQNVDSSSHRGTHTTDSKGCIFPVSREQRPRSDLQPILDYLLINNKSYSDYQHHFSSDPVMMRLTWIGILCSLFLHCTYTAV